MRETAGKQTLVERADRNSVGTVGTTAGDAVCLTVDWIVLSRFERCVGAVGTTWLKKLGSIIGDVHDDIVRSFRLSGW